VDLASQQRALLELVETGSLPAASADDPYLREVANSHGLRVVREIVARWETFDIRRSCPLTAAALDRSGRFDELVHASSFGDGGAFVESRSRLFLEEVARRESGVVGSVARFELALALVRRGDSRRHVVEWECDPAHLIEALAAGERAVEPRPGRFRTVIAADLPGLVSIERLPAHQR
jgi:hypothetical protein